MSFLTPSNQFWNSVHINFQTVTTPEETQILSSPKLWKENTHGHMISSKEERKIISLSAFLSWLINRGNTESSFPHSSESNSQTVWLTSSHCSEDISLQMSAVERDKVKLEKFHTEEPQVSFNPTLKLTRELTQGPGLLRVQDLVLREGERKDVMPPCCRFPPSTFLLHLLLLQPWSRRSHYHYPEAPVRVRRVGGGGNES